MHPKPSLDYPLSLISNNDLKSVIHYFKYYKCHDLVNQCGSCGRTQLFYAIVVNNYDIVKYLINKGADVNTESNGLYPLYIAALEGYDQIFNLLLLHKADYRNCSITHIVRNGNYNILKILHKYYSAHNLYYNKDNSEKYIGNLFAIAFKNSDIDIIELLYSKIIFANKIIHNLKIYKYNPLHPAVINGSLNLVRFLLIENFDINSPAAKNGVTPVYLASKYGHLNMLSFLIYNEANLDSCNKKDNSSPLDVALNNSHYGCAALLMCNGAKFNNSFSKIYKNVTLQSKISSTIEFITKNTDIYIDRLCDNKILELKKSGLFYVITLINKVKLCDEISNKDLVILTRA